jgi:hypothetical protein
MKKIKLLTVTFTFLVLIIILSASWLVFLLINNIHLVYEQPTFLIVLIIAITSFTLSFFFISQLITDVRIEIQKEKEKQKNIRELYQYDQLLDPPSMYN